MSLKVSLKVVAQETLEILEHGEYVNASGETVSIASDQFKAEQGTKLYQPDQLAKLLYQESHHHHHQIQIRVTHETTQQAAFRLVVTEGFQDLVVLNFASARNPGGGFMKGAKAQEEDLSRCSGLYRCQLQQPQYYEMNRAYSSLLYTDHLIYSPKVPWFRVHNQHLLDSYYLASVITAPAPNAGQVLRRDPKAWSRIEVALRQRAGYILAVAQDHGHRSLLLGAWGCGVFQNSPTMVADAFGQWLEHPRFLGCFDRVIFGVYDPSKTQTTLKSFQARFH